MMPAEPIEIAKLRVAIIGGIVGAVSLLIAFLSYLASVERDRIDRTFQLMSTSEDGVQNARSEFQTILRLMASYPVKLQSEANKNAFYTAFLTGYQGNKDPRSPGVAAWDVVLPLGDYYERVLLCAEENACSKKIYCTMLEAELMTFATVTQDFRETSLNQQSVFAAPLDNARKRVRCA